MTFPAKQIWVIYKTQKTFLSPPEVPQVPPGETNHKTYLAMAEHREFQKTMVGSSRKIRMPEKACVCSKDVKACKMPLPSLGAKSGFFVVVLLLVCLARCRRTPMSRYTSRVLLGITRVRM